MPSMWDRLRGGNSRPWGARHGQEPNIQERVLDSVREGSRRAGRGVGDYLAEGQGALNQTAMSAWQSMMPDYLDSLQITREDAIARGVSVGDYGVGEEHQLADRFNRNLANSIAGQAMNLYGSAVGQEQADEDRYLDQIYGERDYETAQRNAKKKRFGLGSLIGGALSFIPGGGLASDILFSGD